jgi:hypothetical protein
MILVGSPLTSIMDSPLCGNGRRFCDC